MKRIVTTGIVLARTNYQEADRIVTLLTPDQGKLRLMCKGVRRAKSKMAGGIELFSIGEITFMPGKSDLHTLISSRLKTHYGNIVKDIDKTMYGYEILRAVNKITEESFEKEYFELVEASLEGLNSSKLSLKYLELWFDMQLLKLTGHSPNLKTDSSGRDLIQKQKYNFSSSDMVFTQSKSGAYDANHIKLLRIASSVAKPVTLLRIEKGDVIISATQKLSRSMARHHLFN